MREAEFPLGTEPALTVQHVPGPVIRMREPRRPEHRALRGGERSRDSRARQRPVEWLSERSGYNHLYRYAEDGSGARALTSGEWVITGLHRIDEAAGLAYFSATKDSPLERHLYSVPLGGGEVRKLTSEPGVHGVTVSKDGARFIDYWTTRAHGARVVIRGADGALDGPVRLGGR